jgi:hypothetical protein
MTTKISSDNIQQSTLDTLGAGPKITAVNAGTATAVIPAGGELVTVTGSGFLEGATIYIESANVTTTFSSSTSLTFTSPAKTVGAYQIYVYNTDGSFAIKPGGMIYFDAPVWTTPSGALTGGSPTFAYSTTVVATGGTITYSVTSGSLPTGLGLNTSTGVISGTPTTEQTFNFTITATNQYNQTTARAFSISIASAPASIDFLVVAGGGGGGGGITSPGGSGGGAGGYRSFTNQSITAGVSYSIVVGAGGVAGQNSSVLASKGSDSSFHTFTATGGGAGQHYLQSFDSARHSGGSGGGAPWNSNNFGSGNTPSTSPSQGNNGGGIGSSGGQPSSGGGGIGSAGSAYSSSGGQGGAGVTNNISNQVFTITIASPGVLTLTRALSNGTVVRLITTGALPTGLSTGTDYFVVNSSGSTCQLSTSSGGSAITTSGSQSGTHTITQYFSGGGGGGAGISSTQGFGQHGGGNGGTNAPTAGSPGAAFTGGGGGGAGEQQSGSNNGGAGGAGIIIVRYDGGFAPATGTTGSPTTYTDGTYRYYVYTGNGSITF